jgi:hypothetical protein
MAEGTAKRFALDRISDMSAMASTPQEAFPVHAMHSQISSRRAQLRRSAFGFGRIQGHGGANERLQRLLIDLVPLMDIDGAPHIAFEAGVEEA